METKILGIAKSYAFLLDKCGSYVILFHQRTFTTEVFMNIRITPVATTGKSPPLSIPDRIVPRPTKKIRVGLVQLNSSFSGQYYLPLSAGMLQAYAQKYLAYAEDYDFTMPIYKFLRIEEASEMLSDCDIVGISSYVWNEQNSLAIAQDYKRRNPDGIVIFGGPQIPNSKKQFRRIRTADLTAKELQRERTNFTPNFHQTYPFIDMACHGEGERVFKTILEQVAIDKCQNKNALPSVSYIDTDGIFHFNPEMGRMQDAELAQAPSPLTTGIFDKLMTDCQGQRWILMYETDRGCPYTCTYCDWGGATEDRVAKFSLEQIYADIMWLGERIPYVFLCNANFGILERDVQIAEFFAEAKFKFKRLEGVSTQNAKNPKKHTIAALKVLERAGLNKATVMSQQSLNPATLRAVRRDNMKLDEYYEIQKQLAAEGIYTMTDIIIPMPEETYDSIANAISTLISRGQHNKIQFNNLSILRNTEMGDPEYQKNYEMKIIKTKIINGHGKKNDSISGVEEWQELVVATKTMPPDEWIKTRAFCWMTNLLYFNKLLQIPSIVLHEIYGISYRETFEVFFNSRSEKYPIFFEINEFFEKIAQNIQDGRQEEFVHSQEWLNIWWPPEEYIFIKICIENKLKQFYQEVEKIIEGLLKTDMPIEPILDAIHLNKELIKLPHQTADLEISLSYNIWDLYKKVLLGQKIPLMPGILKYTIDRTTETWSSWNEWCEKMVWYGNRRGAYLYGNKPAGAEIAGHH